MVGAPCQVERLDRILAGREPHHDVSGDGLVAHLTLQPRHRDLARHAGFLRYAGRFEVEPHAARHLAPRRFGVESSPRERESPIDRGLPAQRAVAGHAAIQHLALDVVEVDAPRIARAIELPARGGQLAREQLSIARQAIPLGVAG